MRNTKCVCVCARACMYKIIDRKRFVSSDTCTTTSFCETVRRKRVVLNELLLTYVPCLCMRVSVGPTLWVCALKVSNLLTMFNEHFSYAMHAGARSFFFILRFSRSSFVFTGPFVAAIIIIIVFSSFNISLQ